MSYNTEINEWYRPGDPNSSPYFDYGLEDTCHQRKMEYRSSVPSCVAVGQSSWVEVYRTRNGELVGFATVAECRASGLTDLERVGSWRSYLGTDGRRYDRYSWHSQQLGIAVLHVDFPCSV